MHVSNSRVCVQLYACDSTTNRILGVYVMWEWVGKLHVYGADTNVILEVSETSFMCRSV